MPGYHKPYRLDITDKQGGLLVYIKYHLPSKLLSIHNTYNDIQVIPFELNLRKEMWIFLCIYRPPKQNSQYFSENSSSIADHYSSIYDNYIFLEDFNMEPNCLALTSFMQSFNMFNLINPLSANPEKWSNTLKQFVANLPTNCLSVFDHFMNLALKGLKLLHVSKVKVLV